LDRFFHELRRTREIIVRVASHGALLCAPLRTQRAGWCRAFRIARRVAVKDREARLGYNPRMPTVRLIVRYDGTGLAGWQRQRGVRTVQEELERAVQEMSGAPARVHGAGRTDAGVHAHAQVAAFETQASIPAKGWMLGLTSLLPPQIAVREARYVPDGYDPRRASGGKRYRYLVLTDRVRDPLLRDRAWHVHDEIDVEAMRVASAALVGSHDFRAFRASDCERINTVRHLFRVAWRHHYADRPGLLAFEVEGTAFLKNMVRIIVGTLIEIGRGRRDPNSIPDLIASGDRTRTGVTAPPHGLYLDEVFVRPEFRLEDDSLQLRPDAAGAPSSEPLSTEDITSDDE
jgi:tRNA pseudouridine38-40 synthase